MGIAGKLEIFVCFLLISLTFYLFYKKFKPLAIHHIEFEIYQLTHLVPMKLKDHHALLSGYVCFLESTPLLDLSQLSDVNTFNSNNHHSPPLPRILV